MITDPKCPKCGKNLALVGTVHRCVPNRIVAGLREALAHSKGEGDARVTMLKVEERQAAMIEKLVRPPVSDPPEGSMDQKLIRMPSELWDKVDDYKHARRLTSRAAAVRELVEKGLLHI